MSKRDSQHVSRSHDTSLSSNSSQEARKLRTKTSTRRSFLKTASTAVAGPTILSACTTTAKGPTGAIETVPKTAASDRIVMGVIGLGWQGPGNLNQFLYDRHVQVVAACDVDRGHLRAGKKMVDEKYENTDCATYNNFEDMFARGDLDCVSIALPDHWHAVPAIMAADLGLDIYGEKPLSHSLVEGRAICDAVKRNKRIWQTGSWQRSQKNFHHAAELVRNGRIGKVKYVEVGLGGNHDDYTNSRDKTAFCDPPAGLDYDRWLGPAPKAPYCPARVHKNWRWIMDYGGGKLMDWIGHHLDIAHWGMGLDDTGPVLVEGTGVIPENQLWNAPTGFDCTCTYADGLVIKIGSKYAGGAKWYGDEGWLRVDRGKLEAEKPAVLKEKIGENEIQVYRSRDHFTNFTKCIMSREATITPCETAHRSASVGHLCNIAIYTGRKIRWNPKTEKIANDAEATKMLSCAYRKPWQLKTA